MPDTHRDTEKKFRERDQLWWEALVMYGLNKSQSAEAFTSQLHKVAVERYGSTSESVKPKTLQRWVNADRIFPLWARLAILDVCKDLGWVPQNLKDLDIAYSLWAKWYADMSPERFGEEFSVSPDLSTHLKQMA